MKRKWQDKIVIDPDLHHSEACINGTRIPVTMIVGSLADGLTEEIQHFVSNMGAIAPSTA